MALFWAFEAAFVIHMGWVSCFTIPKPNQTTEVRNLKEDGYPPIRLRLTVRLAQFDFGSENTFLNEYQVHITAHLYMNLLNHCVKYSCG